MEKIEILLLISGIVISSSFGCESIQKCDKEFEVIFNGYDFHNQDIKIALKELARGKIRPPDQVLVGHVGVVYDGEEFAFAPNGITSSSEWVDIK